MEDAYGENKYINQGASSPAHASQRWADHTVRWSMFRVVRVPEGFSERLLKGSIRQGGLRRGVFVSRSSLRNPAKLPAWEMSCWTGWARGRRNPAPVSWRPRAGDQPHWEAVDPGCLFPMPWASPPQAPCFPALSADFMCHEEFSLTR